MGKVVSVQREEGSSKKGDIISSKRVKDHAEMIIYLFVNSEL